MPIFEKVPAILVGSVTSLLTTTAALSLFTEWPYLKHLEVYFYDQNNSETERVRLWIEDLGNLSKAQYFKKATVAQVSTNSEQGSWEYLATQDTQGTDYKKLINLARQFIETQHYLNVARAIYTSKNWNFTSSTNTLSVKCSDCCKNKSSCACLCCFIGDNADCCSEGKQNCDIVSLTQKQSLFSYYLSNLNAPFQNVYLTPVQAHIKLSDSTFSTDLKITQDDSNVSTNSSKIMIGSLVYGFVDYSYKETVIPNNDELKEYISSNLNSTSSSSSTGDDKKYFYNIPQQFNFNINIASNNTSNKKTISDFWNSLNKNATGEIQLLISKISDSGEIECCCSDEKNELDCLIKRNFVVEETDLSKIQTKIKDSKNCCTSKAS